MTKKGYQEALEVTDGNYTGISGRGVKVDPKGKLIPASPFDWACGSGFSYESEVKYSR